MLLPRQQISLDSYRFEHFKTETLGPIDVPRTLQVPVWMLISQQLFPVLI
jgi:hypothetical protein